MGVAVLLEAIGTRGARAAAAKLSEQATTQAGERREVTLTNEEMSALLDALTDLAHGSTPDRLLAVKSELATELGRG